MGFITLTFANKLNVSIQEGDTVYYTNDVNGETIVKIGLINEVDRLLNKITASISDSTVRPTLISFILFSKTNKANIGSLKGYYAEVGMVNDSTEKIELFSLSSEAFESSK